MHYLSKEFTRLVKYAEGLGIKVTLSNKVDPDASAVWVTDGSEIILYDQTKAGPLKSCLLLIHELAHHMSYVHSGRKGNMYTNRLLEKENSGGTLTKKQRQHIYEMEKADSAYQPIIHKEIGSKIPIERLTKEIEYDMWQYKFWVNHNRLPKTKEQRAFRKKQREKIQRN